MSETAEATPLAKENASKPKANQPWHGLCTVGGPWQWSASPKPLRQVAVRAPGRTSCRMFGRALLWPKPKRPWPAWPQVKTSAAEEQLGTCGCYGYVVLTSATLLPICSCDGSALTLGIRHSFNHICCLAMGSTARVRLGSSSGIQK